MRSASEQTENWVEDFTRVEAERMGAVTVKNQRRTGWPDRTFYWFGGVSDVIEFKRPKGGRYGALQLRTHVKLRERGHNVLVINTREQALQYLASREQYAKRKMRAI